MTLPARNEYTCPRGCCRVLVINNGPRVTATIVLNGKATRIREIAKLGGARISVQSLRGRIERGCCLRMRRQNRGRPAPRRGRVIVPNIRTDSDRLAVRFNSLRWSVHA